MWSAGESQTVCLLACPQTGPRHQRQQQQYYCHHAAPHKTHPRPPTPTHLMVRQPHLQHREEALHILDKLAATCVCQ